MYDNEILGKSIFLNKPIQASAT